MDGSPNILSESGLKKTVIWYIKVFYKMKKVKVGIIGIGNIGTDLLIKIQRSEFLECGIFAERIKNPKE